MWPLFAVSGSSLLYTYTVCTSLRCVVRSRKGLSSRVRGRSVRDSESVSVGQVELHGHACAFNQLFTPLYSVHLAFFVHAPDYLPPSAPASALVAHPSLHVDTLGVCEAKGCEHG